MYIRDPSGNLVEVNHHDVDNLDQTLIREITPREEVTEQTGGALNARLYHDDMLTDLT
jgi:hypothetical protein